MTLVVTGLSHHTSDVALRERLAFPRETVSGALVQLRKSIGDGGAVLYSTCNRSEVYLNAPGEPVDLHSEIRRFLSEWHDIPEAEFRDALYEYNGRETVSHLFKVASSLDALVVGESQVLGQVHEAYQLAQTKNSTDKIINALFQKAFSVAKKVRSQSDITVGKVSISSVAVDLAVSIFMDLSGKTVMVIGAGQMGELTLRSLVAKGVAQVLVVNRSVEKAKSLAAEYSGEGLALSELDEHLHRADVIISSTGSPAVVLRANHFQNALKRRDQQPMLVIDIAVPRDVDAAVGQLDNIYSYTVDDLQEVADRNLESRRAEVDKCLEIVEVGVGQFHRWMTSLMAEPTIVSLSKELNEIRERELKKTFARLTDLTEAQQEEVTYLSKRLINNMLQRPLTQIKREAAEEDQGSMLQLVRRLFGLKEGI